MNNFNEWSQIITKLLKAEGDLLTSVAKHQIDADSSRSAFIRVVLEQFLPSNYSVGSGLIIDSKGNSSGPHDVVIYRCDFPRLNLPGSSDVFLYESVLAVIEVHTKLIRKTLFEALDICAALGELSPDINPISLKTLAAQNKMKLNENNEYVHDHPMLTDRFNLIGRPLAFIYGYNGFKSSPHQLCSTLNIWLDKRKEDNQNTGLKSLPTVIATQGCIGWRNAERLAANTNYLFGVAADSSPIRLIILQLLNQLNRRLRSSPVGYGLKPSVDAYLNEMTLPEAQFTIGKATANRAQIKQTEKPTSREANDTDQSTVLRPQAETRPRPAIQSNKLATPNTAPNKSTVETRSEQEPEQKNKVYSKPMFENSSMPTAKPAVPENEPNEVVDQKVSSIPKPTLGAMYHQDSSTVSIPAPDPSLLPDDPSPESITDNKIESKPGLDNETIGASGEDSKPIPPSEPKTPIETTPNAENEASQFDQTVRLPESALPKSEPSQEPFLKTIPGLQDPAKSVH